MKSMIRIALLPIATLLLLGSAVADTDESSESAGETSPGVVVKVERAVERGAKATVRGVKRGAHAAARGIKHGAKAAAKGVKRGARATGKAAHNVANKIGGSPAPSSSPGAEQ